MIITAVYLFLFLIITITTMMAKAAENWCNLYKFTQSAMCIRFRVIWLMSDLKKKQKKQYSCRFRHIFI
jgi:hypothetical protein